MDHIKALYETPDVEEIVFASLDAIALSDGGEAGGDEEVGDDFWS